MKGHCSFNCKVLFIGFAMLALAPAASAGGSHFLVEPFTGVTFNQGYSLENAVALESGLVLGIGGKLKNFPPRFFLYFRVSESLFGDDDVTISSRNATGTVNRSYTRLSGGLRVIIPLFWKLRLNLEAGGGTLFSSNKYSESGMKAIEYNENYAVVEAGAGLDLRLFEWLSVGLTYNYSFVAQKDQCDLIAGFLGEKDSGSKLGWSHLTATIGFHF